MSCDLDVQCPLRTVPAPSRQRDGMGFTPCRNSRLVISDVVMKLAESERYCCTRPRQQFRRLKCPQQNLAIGVGSITVSLQMRERGQDLPFVEIDTLTPCGEQRLAGAFEPAKRQRKAAMQGEQTWCADAARECVFAQLKSSRLPPCLLDEQRRVV